MLDGLFYLNSPLGIILNLLSTISFSDSVDELEDETEVKDEDDEGDLSLFSYLDFDFFLFFLLERFTVSGLDEGEFLFLYLNLCCLSRLTYVTCLLVEKLSGCFGILFIDSSCELPPALSFFDPASSPELTTGETTFASY